VETCDFVARCESLDGLADGFDETRAIIALVEGYVEVGAMRVFPVLWVGGCGNDADEKVVGTWLAGML
jgi:hypothetical protein